MRARTAALAATIPAILATISCADDTSPPAGPTMIDAPAAVAAVPTGNTDHRPTGQGGSVVGVQDVSPRPAPPVRMLIELPAVEVGGTIQLRSTCDTPATWETSDATVATVDDGLVTGVAAGRTRISETCGGVTSSVSVEVVAAPDVSYAFDPTPPARIDEGDTGHFRVNVTRDGRRSRVTEGVTSSAPDVLRLALEGDRWRYTGIVAGSAEIRVTQGGSRRLTHSVRVMDRPEPWRRSGTTATIIDLPTRITRIRIEGEYRGSSENFVVWCGTVGNRGGLLVNEILGTFFGSTTYSGVHSALRSYGGRGQPCRQLEIGDSGVRWTITETSPRSGFTSPSTGGVRGDEAAVRRAREQVDRAMNATRTR